MFPAMSASSCGVVVEADKLPDASRAALNSKSTCRLVRVSETRSNPGLPRSSGGVVTGARSMRIYTLYDDGHGRQNNQGP